MVQIEVEIEGIRSLLMNNPKKTIFATESKKQIGATKGVPPEDLLYLTKDGKLYTPNTHIEKAMEKAALNYKIPGKRGKSYKDLVKAFILVFPKQIIHLIQDWEPFGTSVIIQRSRVWKERPMLNKWSLRFTIEVLNDAISTEVVKEILEYAGAFNGLGDWRPKFGLFKVTSFKEVT